MNRLAASIPKGSRKRKIVHEAEVHDIPQALMLAVYALETSFRPWWVQIVETCYLLGAVLWWLTTGQGFRNVTVGPFQFGCHWVAHYNGFEYTRRGTIWHPRRSLALAGALIKLPLFSYNAEMAALRLACLWTESTKKLGESAQAVVDVGRQYNGTEWYGQTLLQLVDYLTKNRNE